jgi:predicted DNA-binding protein with PD1-like motif
MDYRKFGETFYIRMDKGDEIIQTILDLCRKEGIGSAYFTGIGGCSDVDMQTFIAELGDFETEHVEGTLELVNLTGNVVSDEDGKLYHHTHGIFSYRDQDGHHMVAGHMKSSTVLYTAEIELRPVIGGVIGRTFDPETGTGFWDLWADR